MITVVGADFFATRLLENVVYALPLWRRLRFSSTRFIISPVFRQLE